MNIEIQSAEIENNNPHIFTFNKPIKQFMAGFSKCFIEFSKDDHHIKEISIDLSNSEIKNNEIIIKPLLKMNDSSDHKESPKSSITVVVIAIIDEGNPDIHVNTAIKTDENTDLPIKQKPTFIKSALSYSAVQYTDSDHHLYSYFAEITPVLDGNFFSLKGQSVIQDQKEHSGNGEVLGAVIIYYGKDQKVLYADFNSKQIPPDHTGKIGDTQTVCFGDVPENFNCDNYDLGCFISSYELSYDELTYHHVSTIEISAMLSEKKLFVNEGKAYSNVCLKSFLSDDGKNQFDIPHNNVCGFVIALNNKPSD